MDQGKLQEFYNSDMELDDDDLSEWSTSEFVNAKMELLVADYKAAAWALQIPRRLGGQATGKELSMDKKFMRRVMHLNKKMFDRWQPMATADLPVDWTAIGPDEKSSGARIDQCEFIRLRLYINKRQIESTATVSIQSGLLSWGCSAVRLLEAENAELLRIREVHGLD